LGLPPEVAIGTGLVTEVFGFDSGLYAYATKRLMDYRLGVALLIVTIPMALVGTSVFGCSGAGQPWGCPGGRARRRDGELLAGYEPRERRAHWLGYPAWGGYPGLGELNGYFLLQRCRVPSKGAVATNVFVAARALTASIGHAVHQFAQGDHSELGPILSLLFHDAQGDRRRPDGSTVARYIPQRTMTVGMGILLILRFMQRCDGTQEG
jgi:hypothetical protein